MIDANKNAPAEADELRIDGRNVVLREFRLSDLEDSMCIVGDDRVTRWLSFDTKTIDQQEMLLRGVIERANASPRQEYYLAVMERETSRFAGFIRLGLAGVEAAKLGYAIRCDMQGRGLATDATQAMIDFGFAQLELHRISAAIGPDNYASLHVVQKLGMSREGRIRDHVFTNGAWRDSELYSILRHEWMATWPDR